MLNQKQSSFFIDTFKDVYFMCIFTSLNLVSHYFKNCTSFKLVCKGHNDVALVDAFEATLLVVNFNLCQNLDEDIIIMV